MKIVTNAKKLILLSVVGSAVSLFSLITHVSAAEYSGTMENEKNAIAETPTPNKLDNFDPAVKMPDGGYLMGEGNFTIIESDGTKKIIDPKTTTYQVTTTGQALKDVEKKSENTLSKNNKIVSRVMLPNNNTPSRSKIATSKVILGNNQSYSEALVGNGWRFASYIFQPSSGTGGYLKWTSIRDSGRVMDLDDNAHFENQGWIMGSVLNNGVPIMFQGKINYWATYYSYSPTPGSYYYVINQNL
ncbi:hypothetical protein [Leuconostoc suionicum]|uniref:hypothetical protein n=1 Tax=Leuconostoc suionicum TaxID=1511761 RepID=UPI00300D5279